MKKFILFLLVFCICFCAVGCNDETSKNSENNSPEMQTKIVVPDVFGMSVTEAIETLENVGLEVELKKESSTDKDDFVCNQSPASGISIEKGSSVIITYYAGLHSINEDGSVNLESWNTVQHDGNKLIIPKERYGRKVYSVNFRISIMINECIKASQYKEIYVPNDIVFLDYNGNIIEEPFDNTDKIIQY